METKEIMTPEEKYDKALDKARELISRCIYNRDRKTMIYRVEDIESIFPELKESEDEKIRKAIIEFFELQDDNTTYSFVSKKDILAWLEKQTSKSKWSEEDEDNLNLAIYHIRCDNFSYSPHDIEPIVDWLKSIKQRMEEHQ